VRGQPLGPVARCGKPCSGLGSGGAGGVLSVCGGGGVVGRAPLPAWSVVSSVLGRAVNSAARSASARARAASASLCSYTAVAYSLSARALLLAPARTAPLAAPLPRRPKPRPRRASRIHIVGCATTRSVQHITSKFFQIHTETDRYGMLIFQSRIRHSSPLCASEVKVLFVMKPLSKTDTTPPILLFENLPTDEHG
jgi:hypothetical protein